MESLKITAGYLKDILEHVPPESEVFIKQSEENKDLHHISAVLVIDFIDRNSGEFKHRVEIIEACE